MKHLFMAIVSVILLGCAPSNGRVTPSTVQMTHSAFLGKKITLFILSNGAPYHKRRTPNGGAVYAWNSRTLTLLPRTRPPWDDDHFMESECEIRIYTEANGRVRSIFALNDPSHDWDPSACADYLK